MATVQITLRAVEGGDYQDWADVESAVHRVLPINRSLKVADGLSGDINTYVNGFQVKVRVLAEEPDVDEYQSVDETLDEFRARRLRDVEENGGVIKLTGPNSLLTPGA